MLRGALFPGPSTMPFCLAFGAGRLPHVWVPRDPVCKAALLHTVERVPCLACTASVSPNRSFQSLSRAPGRQQTPNPCTPGNSSTY